MKKRLLSAALALAMVLTLLPATVFAVDPPTAGANENPKKSVTVTRQTAVNASTGQLMDAWYWTDTSSGSTVYHAVTGGVVNGTGTSGTWYSWDADPDTGIVSTSGTNKTMKTTSFTLLDDYGIDTLGLTTNPTSLTVDVNDHTLTLASNIDTLSSLTIYNKYGSAATGTVSAISKTEVYKANGTEAQKAVKSLTLNVTNATVPSITLQNGVANTINLHNGAIVGAITLDSTNTDAKGNTIFTGAQILKTDGASQITGAISMTGVGSQLTLANVTGPTGAVTFTSTGGSIAVSGYSDVGKMTITTNATTATAASYPSINITGGTVAGIDTSTDANTTSSATVTVSGATIGSDGITVKSGTVNVNAGSNVTGTITVPSGALNITGGASGTSTGSIVLNSTGKTTLRVTNSNVVTKGISATNGATLTVDIPNDLSNKFGTLSLAGYTGGGIKGGKFKTQATDSDTAKYFASTLRFMVAEKASADKGYYGYYGERDLAAAINALGDDAATAGNIVLVGHTAANNITLQNGTTVAKKALIGYSKLTSFYLPNLLLGDTITGWTNSTDNVPYGPDALYTTPSTPADVTLVGQDTGIQLAATKLNSAKVAASEAYTKGIRANLVGNVITLSGAVNTDGGYTAIPLELETDVRDATGAYEKVYPTVVYDSNKKTVAFDMSGYSALAAKSIVLSETSLTMNGGKTVYTLSGSGLGTPAAGLGTYDASTEIQVTVNKAGWTDYQKKALIDKMTGDNGEFTWNTIPAMMQAVNAAQLSINNDNTLKSWITSAENYIWYRGNGFTGTEASKGAGDGNLKPHTTSAPTEAQRSTADFTGIQAKYAKVWLVPYLQVTVTDVNEATGYMTMTLTPSYRVDVSAEGGYDPDEYYTVQAGRSLGTITGEFDTGVTVQFKGLTNPLAKAWMHQDGTYAYQGSGGKWTIDHGSSNGLGSMVINTKAPLIELKNNDGASATPNKHWYDTLQAAVDDTKYNAAGESDATKLDLIDVNAGYTGTGAINVTGEARTFRVHVDGNTNITASASGDLVKVTGGGHDYTIQLLKDTAEAGKNIVVASATGGSATVSANPAAAGQTVTVTLSAQAGYAPNGVTVKTASGTTVNTSGSGNTYTFTMPSSGTVTVTPSFKASDTSALIQYSNNYQGTARAITGTADGKAQQGSKVPVTVTPNSGYRTLGLAAQSNTGSTVKVERTDVNTFDVTVPAGATTVTVTPRFDFDNGTPFTDVLSSRWSSSEVSWIYNKGYTTGYGNKYTFAPTNQCTRWEMVTFLWKAAGYQEVNIANPFKDVSPTYPNAQAYKAIMWAVSRGLVDTSSGYFYPESKISRADTVVILYKNANSPVVYGSSGFKDVASNAYYAKAVTWARQKDLTNGYNGNTYFQPSYTITREEIAAFLYRAYG